jgi:NhaA family Na+:H+ antiporter
MRDAQGASPLTRLEHDLHGPVAFAILPIFAFANAGLSLGGMALADLTHPVTLGVILGLLVGKPLGKPLGIMLFVGLALGLRLVALPPRVNWGQLLGVAFVCGIGFTMSLFIAGLAFEHGSGDYFAGDRLGILIGSILAAIAGYLMLHLSLPKAEQGD